MREVITIEYIVLLMTDSYPAALKVFHTEQAKECNDFGSTEVGEVTGGRETQRTFEGISEK